MLDFPVFDPAGIQFSFVVSPHVRKGEVIRGGFESNPRVMFLFHDEEDKSAFVERMKAAYPAFETSPSQDFVSFVWTR